MRLDPDLLTKKLSHLGTLTPRQSELIRLTLLGQALPQIAMRMGTAIRTAKMHRKDAFEKLHVNSTGELWQLLFRLAGHGLESINGHDVRWGELFKLIGDEVSVDRVVRLTGRTKSAVVKQLERHGYNVD